MSFLLILFRSFTKDAARKTSEKNAEIANVRITIVRETSLYGNKLLLSEFPSNKYIAMISPDIKPVIDKVYLKVNLMY